ncbi:MAG: glycogen debranching protein GlgX [Acidimicrobiia bacterium]
MAVPGRPSPLGATRRDGGVNSRCVRRGGIGHALLDGAEGGTEERIPLTDVDDGVWHGFVPGVGPGTRYGYRVDGPRDVTRGERCDPAKLLLDPYALVVTGDLVAHDDVTTPGADSAPYVPKSAVPPDLGSRPGERSEPRSWADTVVYECHVKGMTAQHPAVPEALRGTYAGFAHDAVLEHLTNLGVTAVELLPVAQSATELRLLRAGRTNYWGYNPIAFLAPHLAYSAAARAGDPLGVLDEFTAMVERLHGAGLEVILDVVFNHTAEGDHHGPTLCYRGLDNAGYYHLDPDRPSHYVDTTGCGHSFRAGSPRGLRLVMDALRHWVTVMGVDGFRFDLATTLGRDDEAADFSPDAALFEAIAQDPVLREVKLIAEPWDVGRPDSYELGRFPAPWVEWNGAYRDCVRDFWRSHEGSLAEFATRITGSSDLYGARHSHPARRPLASVNFVTAHDGFTLRDLVSYDVKHNEANGEHNRDGADDNRSWNCGVEGHTDDPEVLALRSRQQRAVLATLLLSFGVPMLLGGDELGRTQHGNNNPYSHDDDLSWIAWDSPDEQLLAFTRGLLALRAAHPVFRRRRFLGGTEASELSWFGVDGQAMSAESWDDPASRSVVLFLDGGHDPDRADDGTLLVDDDFLLAVNAWWEPLDLVIPDVGGGWHRAVDTFTGELHPRGTHAGAPLAAGDRVNLGPRTLSVLRRPAMM